MNVVHTAFDFELASLFFEKSGAIAERFLVNGGRRDRRAKQRGGRKLCRSCSWSLLLRYGNGTHRRSDHRLASSHALRFVDDVINRLFDLSYSFRNDRLLLQTLFFFLLCFSQSSLVGPRNLPLRPPLGNV